MFEDLSLHVTEMAEDLTFPLDAFLELAGMPQPAAVSSLQGEKVFWDTDQPVLNEAARWIALVCFMVLWFRPICMYNLPPRRTELIEAQKQAIAARGVTELPYDIEHSGASERESLLPRPSTTRHSRMSHQELAAIIYSSDDDKGQPHAQDKEVKFELAQQPFISSNVGPRLFLFNIGFTVTLIVYFSCWRIMDTATIFHARQVQGLTTHGPDPWYVTQAPSNRGEFLFQLVAFFGFLVNLSIAVQFIFFSDPDCWRKSYHVLVYVCASYPILLLLIRFGAFASHRFSTGWTRVTIGSLFVCFVLCWDTIPMIFNMQNTFKTRRITALQLDLVDTIAQLLGSTFIFVWDWNTQDQFQTDIKTLGGIDTRNVFKGWCSLTGLGLGALLLGISAALNLVLYISQHVRIAERQREDEEKAKAGQHPLGNLNSTVFIRYCCQETLYERGILVHDKGYTPGQFLRIFCINMSPDVRKKLSPILTSELKAILQQKEVSITAEGNHANAQPERFHSVSSRSSRGQEVVAEMTAYGTDQNPPKRLNQGVSQRGEQRTSQQGEQRSSQEGEEPTSEQGEPRVSRRGSKRSGSQRFSHRGEPVLE